MPIIAAITVIIAFLKAASPLVKIPLKIAMLVAVFLFMPIPEFVSSIPSKVAALPPAFQWALWVSQLQFGIAALTTAYLMRAAWEIFSGSVQGS